ENWEALTEQYEPLPDTLVVDTPSGGLHLYFKDPSGEAQNTVDRLGQGIDTRAKGGYVAAPGSSRPDGDYRTVDGWHDIAEAPDWLVDAARRTASARKLEVGQAVKVAPESAVRDASERLRTFPPAIEGQGGDLQTFRAVCLV